MSELTERLRKAAYTVRSPRATDVIALCDTHEALEAEHARICNEHALLVQESGREGRELDRLEGLLRAWAIADPNDDQELSRTKGAIYVEGIRLAKVKP